MSHNISPSLCDVTLFSWPSRAIHVVSSFSHHPFLKTQISFQAGDTLNYLCFPKHTLCHQSLFLLPLILVISILSVRLELTSQLFQEAFPDFQQLRCPHVCSSTVPYAYFCLGICHTVWKFTCLCHTILLFTYFYLFHLYFMWWAEVAICSSF